MDRFCRHSHHRRCYDRDCCECEHYSSRGCWRGCCWGPCLRRRTPFWWSEIPLRLRFNSRIDRARSRLTLIRADHSTEVLPILPEGTDDLMLSKVTLTPGSYVVRWQVLAVDGHITRGDIAFTVGAAP